MSLRLGRIYDWAHERLYTQIDSTTLRYALAELRKNREPAHPTAHAEAIRAIEEALEP